MYHFLEQFCGVRWYGPNSISIIIPTQSTLVVKGTEIRRSPALKYRDALWSGFWPFMQKQWGTVSHPEVFLFWRRLKLGGEKWAGNHTFHKQTIQTVFTDSEYQAKGSGAGTQLCYTHPKLVQQVSQMADDFFNGVKNAPEGWKAVGNYFAIVPDDNLKYKKNILINTSLPSLTGNMLFRLVVLSLNRMYLLPHVCIHVITQSTGKCGKTIWHSTMHG